MATENKDERKGEKGGGHGPEGTLQALQAAGPVDLIIVGEVCSPAATCLLAAGTAIYLSSYYYLSVLILLYNRIYLCSPAATCLLAAGTDTLVYLSSYYYVSVLTILYVFPHTTVFCPHTAVCLSSYYYISALILHTTIYNCPHTSICLSSYYYICPHTTIYLSSGYFILVYVCPHANNYLSPYYYMSVLILL